MNIRRINYFFNLSTQNKIKNPNKWIIAYLWNPNLVYENWSKSTDFFEIEKNLSDGGLEIKDCCYIPKEVNETKFPYGIYNFFPFNPI